MNRTSALHRCTAALSFLAVALTASGLEAQSGKAGQVELGAFGAFTKFDGTSLGLDDEFGAGGRLGIFLTRVFSVEANGDYTATNSLAGPANVARIGGTVLAHANVVPWSTFYIGAGYERLFYRGGINADDNGAHVVLGDRISLGGRAALRIEGRATYFPSSPLQVGNDQVFNFGGNVGISIFAFGAPRRDADGDLVVDRRDQCPDTPRGVLVDDVGCPTDQDRDGVFDGPDQCANTPLGASVDAAGCPADTDEDGVYNGIDQCPDTPLGAIVTSTGCPVDSDDDGVFDGLDRCPDTPRGATVDESGCPTDSDGDGVFDGIDQCPNTPLGAIVGPNGCSNDDDGDGVINSLDQCPATPAGVVVDQNGCPPDIDFDGVPNALDQCPATPQGVAVDARGCPLEQDSDGDGVPDSRDRCPNTAPGQQVDGVGCPILFVIEEGRARPLVLRGVNFEVNRSRLTPDSYRILNEVAQSLLAHPEVRIEVAGHTDSTGPYSLNTRLSRERAQSVMGYLASQGVDPSRMVARGYGPDRPIATNETLEGRAQNRRVELHLIEGGN